MDNGQKQAQSFGRVTAVAFVLFSGLFILQRIGRVHFWMGFIFVLLLLISVAFSGRPALVRELLDDFKKRVLLKTAGGLVSGVGLYGIFCAGRLVLSHLFPGDAESLIGQVYRFGEGTSPVGIMLCIGLVIAPGEELFWRGFVQRGFLQTGPAGRALVYAVVLYAVVHWAAANAVLWLAAAVCGVYWGLLYNGFRSITVNAVSHITFDLMAFVLFPFAAV